MGMCVLEPLCSSMFVCVSVGDAGELNALDCRGGQEGAGIAPMQKALRED